jgi:hypothetical protein
MMEAAPFSSGWRFTSGGRFVYFNYEQALQKFNAHERNLNININ